MGNDLVCFAEAGLIMIRYFVADVFASGIRRRCDAPTATRGISFRQRTRLQRL
jgi:hypothetical protein